MNLKTARRIARVTQQQLADKAGVDHSLISHLEHGRRSIGTVSYRTVVRLARALNVEPEELFPVTDLPVEQKTEAAS
jgi:transcriptional regulator with XRE-family HTH domain